MAFIACAGVRLIADIGGTKARFALVRVPGRPEAVCSFPLSDHKSAGDAISTYLSEQAVDPSSLSGMMLAVAGPVQAGKVAMTNAAWHLEQDALSIRFDGVPVQLMNDLAAVALALPYLEDGDAQPVRVGRPKGVTSPLIAINAGTGLGAAVAVPCGAGWIPLATEAGHMRLAAVDDEELVLFRSLNTVEDLLAGPGWRRFQDRQGRKAQRGGGQPDARRLYSRVLGRFAGSMVLATGAWGGVYFCGGVMNDWSTLIDPAALLSSFDGHGPMSRLLRTVPVIRVTLADPALKGLSIAPPV